MIKQLLVFMGAICFAAQAWTAEVLMVADEFPAMQLLARQLKTLEGLDSRVVSQKEMPADLKPFKAVIVYIHRELLPSAEAAFIDYATQGGCLVPLHHSISSGKRKNAHWFKFLGVDLVPGDVAKGGYKWTEGVTLDIVQLAPDHFITTNKVAYPQSIEWKQGKLPGFTLHDSEVYLNHKLLEPRSVLLGLRYTDAKTGQVYLQEHAGWVRPSGKGWIVYLMPGHSSKEFEVSAYVRIVANAVVWTP